MSLSQVVAVLIERWDYMTPEEQGEITSLLLAVVAGDPLA